MTGFLSDLELAARSLRRTPGFTAIVVAMAALGIGTNSANFSTVYEVLLRPIELPDLDRLVMVQDKGPGASQFDDYAIAAPSFLDWRREASWFEELAAYRLSNVSLTGAGPPEALRGGRISPELFPLLRTPAALGRTFSPAEALGTGDKAVVLSDRLWRRRFAADPGIVGRSIQLQGKSHTVVGVMPASFRLPYAAELWLPLGLSPAQREDRSVHDLAVVGRLRPGVTVAAADAEMRAIGQRHARRHPTTQAGHSLRAVPLTYGLTEDSTRAFIHTIMLASLFVLLIVCLNIANLMLARGSTRRRELAVRAALGAGRTRLVRQLLTESLLLALLAGALSLLVAIWTIDFFHAGISSNITRNLPGWERMRLSAPVLGFTLGLSVVTALVFGLAPALQLSRTRIGEALKESGRTLTGGRPLQRVRSALVVAQISMALMLLASAGVLVKGFRRHADPRRGLDPHGVLTLQLAPRGERYEQRAQVLDFQRRALAELRAIPGLESAAAVSSIPWGFFGQSERVAIEGRPALRAEDAPSIELRAITPGYLELLRIPLLAGAPLRPADDHPEAPPLALISESAARRLWPGESAVGRRFRTGEAGPTWTVRGVVGDVSHHWLRHPLPTMYVPSAHAMPSQMYLALRVAEGRDPLLLAQPARGALARVDPELPVSLIQPLEQVLANRISGVRLGSAMMGAFAGLALLLSALGIYGVTAHLVHQRRQEIGIRLALGADPRQVLRLVMGRGLRLTLIGLALGLPAAVALVRLLATTFTEMVDADGALIALLTLLVAALALVGTFLPARQASRVDPLLALRAE